MARRVLPQLLVIVATLAACGHRHGPAADPVSETEWSLTVKNHHWLDVSIFVMYDGQRAHVGTVSATRTETYLLPSTMVSAGRTVRLEANPIGAARTLRTEALVVQGGQHVEWTLESGLERSSLAVW